MNGTCTSQLQPPPSNQNTTIRLKNRSPHSTKTQQTRICRTPPRETRDLTGSTANPHDLRTRTGQIPERLTKPLIRAFADLLRHTRLSVKPLTSPVALTQGKRPQQNASVHRGRAMALTLLTPLPHRAGKRPAPAPGSNAPARPVSRPKYANRVAPATRNQRPRWRPPKGARTGVTIAGRQIPPRQLR